VHLTDMHPNIGNVRKSHPT